MLLVFETPGASMGRRTFSMNEITEILLRWSNGMSCRKISESLGVSRNTIRKITKTAATMGLSVEGCSDSLLLEVSQKIKKERGEFKNKLSPAATLLSSYHEQIKQWLGEPHMTIRQIQRLLSELSPSVKVKSQLTSIYQKTFS
jgi:transposase